MHKCGLVLPLLTFSFCSVLQAYKWSSTLEDNAHVSACVDGNVFFPWSMVTEGTGFKILDIDWLFQEHGKENVSFATYVDGNFLTIKDRFTFIPNAGLFLQGAQAHDAGRYYVIVSVHDPKCRVTSAQRMVTLTVADRPPATQDGALHVTLRDAVRDDVTEDWTLQLNCGLFVDFGHPPADVVWTTPSGEVLNSSYEDNGTFVLSVSSLVQGGNYTCHLHPSAPAARCSTATSPLNAAAQLYVDDKDIRLSFLEARQRELEMANKDQENLLELQAMQISQLTGTMADMLQVNKDQAMQISQLTGTMVQENENQENLLQRQAMQISQQNRTMAEMKAELVEVMQVNKDQAMQISQQNGTIEELKADHLNLTRQCFTLTNKTLDDELSAQNETDLTQGNTTSCVDWLKLDPRSGIRTVYISGTPITVYCDQTTDNGGWIVFQRRQDASVDFYRTWKEYRNGFGDLEGNFWLGLDALHSLTTSLRYQLRVDLKMWNGTRGYATYSGFYLKGSDDNFRLHFDSFTGGNAGDSLSWHRGISFSTKDHQHAWYTKSCAQEYHGAWWYKACFTSNLNADYKPSSRAPKYDGVSWKTFGGQKHSLKFSEMKIRPI